MFPNTRLLWINSYLPNDPLTVQFDERELHETLREIENVLDKSRNSGFSERMKSFTERLGFISV